MNFLVDAHLPRHLALLLREHGYDAIQTLDLPEGNRTIDKRINEILGHTGFVNPSATFFNANLTASCSETLRTGLQTQSRFGLPYRTG